MTINGADFIYSDGDQLSNLNGPIATEASCKLISSHFKSKQSDAENTELTHSNQLQTLQSYQYIAH
jgi:hypothetical protein